MNNEFHTGRIDLHAIEREAHRLRAEATRDAVRAFAGWLRGRLSRSGTPHHA